MSDELKKLIKSSTKTKETYQRLILEAENTIKARDAALKKADAKTGVSDQQAKEDEGFFSTMIKPNASRLNDRCHDLIREIKENETQQNLSSRAFHTKKSNVIEEYRRAMVELVEVDKSRLIQLQENLSSFVVSQELLFDRLKQSVQAIQEHIESFETIGNLHGIINCSPMGSELKQWEETTTTSFLSSEVLQMVGLDSPPAPTTFYAKTDKTVAFLDNFRGVVARAIQTLSEVLEAKRVMRRSTIKCFEKHGYAFIASTNVGTAEHISKPIESRGCIELFISIESPKTRSAWTAVFKALESISQCHMSVGDAYAESCILKLEKVLKNVDSCKQKVKDTVSIGLKKLEQFQQSISKLAGKLTKVVKELSSRKKTLSNRSSAGGSTKEEEETSRCIYLIDFS